MKIATKIISRIGWFLAYILMSPVIAFYAVVVIVLNLFSVPFKARLITFNFDEYSLEDGTYVDKKIKKE